MTATLREAAAASPEIALKALANPMAYRDPSTRRVAPRTFFDWEGNVVASRSVEEFRERLIAGLKTLPPEQRGPELDAMLRELDPSAADMVSSETETLIQQGHAPARALEAALGAVLAARRKKHWWILLNVIIPFQAKKVAVGIYDATPDAKERARRIERLVGTLRPRNARRFNRDDARVRLKELGLSSTEIEQRLARPRVTARDVAHVLRQDLASGVPAPDAMEKALALAMREYAIEYLESQPVALGAEFCVAASIVVAALGVVASAVGIGIQQANAVHAERQARRAQQRQQQAPLSSGEVEQVVAGALRSGATTWGAQQEQAALDYIRVNRFGRTRFVEPEQRSLQTAFNNARAAIVAQQEAARRAQERKTLIGVGIGVVALVGGAFLLKKSRS